jgi:hypothetical protein
MDFFVNRQKSQPIPITEKGIDSIKKFRSDSQTPHLLTKFRSPTQGTFSQ